jgi:hypothetical protein
MEIQKQFGQFVLDAEIVDGKVKSPANTPCPWLNWLIKWPTKP